MMKYNRKLNRLKDFDYSASGGYFVTLCARNMENQFGIIENGKMILNEKGEIAKRYFVEIPKHYREIIIDEHIIMPNHIHGIIMIFNESTESAKTEQRLYGTEQCSVPTDNQFGKLSKVIKSYKDVTTKEIKNKLKDSNFKWQRSYYDRIIRNEIELNKIRGYIINNPINFEFRKELKQIENID